MIKLFRAAVFAVLLAAAPAFAQWQTPDHSVPVGRGAGKTGFGSVVPGAVGIPFLSGGPAADPTYGALNLGGAGVTGNLPPARLNGGLNAGISTFWRGDGTWSITGASLTPSDFGAVCNGVTNDAVPLQSWLDALRDGGIGSFTPSQSILGCASDTPLLLQASTNIGPVQGPRIIGAVRLRGLAGLGGTATGTGSGTNLTLTGVAGKVHVGDTVAGAGINNNTHIVSQISGTPFGNGVYQTDFATAGVAALVVVTSDLLRIWNPTAVTTSQNFYYPILDSLVLDTAGGAVSNCLSLRGFWGSISKILSREGCHAGDLVQFPQFNGPGNIPDEYESQGYIGDLTCIGCSGYVYNNLIGIGASVRAGNIRGTTQGAITTGAGAVRATGGENFSGSIAYTGKGWAVTLSAPPAGGGAIVTTPHEIFMQGAGDQDCTENGVWVAAAEFSKYVGHRMNIEAANGAGLCGNPFPQWPLTAWKFGGGGQRVLSVVAEPYITIRPSVNLAATVLFDFSNDANIANLTVNATISDQTGLLPSTPFATLYQNINPNATIRIIQNGITVYDNVTNTTFAGLPPCIAGNNGSLTRIVTDSTTVVFRANIAGGGGNIVKAACIGTTWVVD